MGPSGSSIGVPEGPSGPSASSLNKVPTVLVGMSHDLKGKKVEVSLKVISLKGVLERWPTVLRIQGIWSFGDQKRVLFSPNLES